MRIAFQFPPYSPVWFKATTYQSLVEKSPEKPLLITSDLYLIIERSKCDYFYITEALFVRKLLY